MISKCSFAIFSKYRGELMGMAILGVCLQVVYLFRLFC